MPLQDAFFIMNLIHGNSEVTFIDNILTVKLVGAFNEFDILKVNNSIKAALEDLNSQKFYMLVDDRELEGLTPEAYQVIEENIGWLDKQNLIAKAFIMKSLIQESLDDHFVPSKKKQNTRAFTDEASAIAWLKTQK